MIGKKKHKSLCNTHPVFYLGCVFFALTTLLFAHLPNANNNLQQANSSKNLQEVMCGPESLSLMCEMLGVPTSPAKIAQFAKTDESGTTLKGLADAAHQLGLNAIGMKIDIGKLLRMKQPVIAHVRQNHFVVVEIITDSQLRIFDPVKSTSIMNPAEFSKIWDGYILRVVSPQAPIQRNNPDIEIENPIFDFGEAAQEQIISHEFSIKNVGSVPLEITSVGQSCVCTATIVSGKIVPPSGRTQILAKYDTKHVRGRQVIDIAIHSNDPDEPVAFATIKGVVAGLTRVSPNYLYFSEIHSSQEVHRIIEVYDPGHGRLQVKKVQASTPFLQTKVHKQSDSALVAIIDVILKPGLPLGKLNEKIIIETNENESPKTEVLVKGEIVGDLKLSPKQFFFGFVNPGDVAKQTVKLTKIGNPDLQIVKIEAPNKSIEVEMATIKPGQEYEIQAICRPSELESLIKGIVRVHTNNAEQLKFEIPIYAIVQ